MKLQNWKKKENISALAVKSEVKNLIRLVSKQNKPRDEGQTEKQISKNNKTDIDRWIWSVTYDYAIHADQMLQGLPCRSRSNCNEYKNLCGFFMLIGRSGFKSILEGVGSLIKCLIYTNEDKWIMSSDKDKCVLNANCEKIYNGRSREFSN